MEGKIVIQVLVLAGLGVVLVEDLKHRAVSWFVFPVLAVLFILLAAQTLPFSEAIMNWSLNIAFIGFQLLFLVGYFSLKERKLSPVVSQYLGWGDICFWLAAAAYFTFAGFIFYFLGSLLVALILHLLFRQLIPLRYSKTIPLAGWQALVLIFIIGAQIFSPQVSFDAESFIYQQLIA